jgi:hypothetical protein
MAMSYFDVLGRLRLSVALSKGFLKLPMSMADFQDVHGTVTLRVISRMIAILVRLK